MPGRCPFGRSSKGIIFYLIIHLSSVIPKLQTDGPTAQISDIASSTPRMYALVWISTYLSLSLVFCPHFLRSILLTVSTLLSPWCSSSDPTPRDRKFNQASTLWTFPKCSVILSFRLNDFKHIGQSKARGSTCCVSICRIKAGLPEKGIECLQSFQKHLKTLWGFLSSKACVSDLKYLMMIKLSGATHFCICGRFRL